MYRYLILYFPLFCTLLLAGDFSYKGNIDIEAIYADYHTENKRVNQQALRLDTELNYSFESDEIAINLKSLYDLKDENRHYIDFNDFYYLHHFEDSDLLIGRNTRFWGAMEFYNITDVFNTKNWLDNPFDFDSKLGANNIAYTYYFNDAQLSIIAKIGEENQKVVNNFLPPNYVKTLKTQKDKNNPIFYLKYSDSIEDIQLDYSLIYQHGYDQQRYLVLNDGKLQQNAYIVDKYMGYFTLVNANTIYKSEIAYTKSKDVVVSDYIQGGFGLEHTFNNVLDNKDFIFLLEYYKYKSFDDNKLGAKEFGNLYANDIALGFRVSMNDIDNSKISGGIDFDLGSYEKMGFIKYETRFYNTYKLSLSYEYYDFENDSLFQSFDRIILNCRYYF